MPDLKKLRRLPKAADLTHIQPDLHVLAVPIGALSGHPGNPRLHGDANRKAIAGSLRKYLQRKPVVANMTEQGLLIEAGHGVYGEMLAAGAQYVAVTVVHDDPVHALGYMIADNRTGDLSEDDPEKLAPILRQLIEAGEDVEEAGWDPEAVNALLKGAEPDSGDDGKPTPEPQVDRAGELQKEWQTEAGQLWLIPSKTGVGVHRVLCGDSTKEEDVARLLSGLSPVMMETDPPYGIDYSKLKDGIPRPGFRNHQEQFGDIENDDLTDGAALQAFLERMIRAAIPFMRPNAAFYFWHPMLTQGTFFAAAAAAADILIHRQIIWVKPGFVLTRSGMYHWRHELCFYGWMRGNKPAWYGDKSQTSVWDDFGRDSDHGMHPTQKPIELFLRPMKNHVKHGEWVYEPFGGSGSQLLAAERHGCLAATMEIAPKYVAVILQRAKDAGLQPRLADV